MATFNGNIKHRFTINNVPNTVVPYALTVVLSSPVSKPTDGCGSDDYPFNNLTSLFNELKRLPVGTPVSIKNNNPGYAYDFNADISCDLGHLGEIKVSNLEGCTIKIAPSVANKTLKIQNARFSALNFEVTGVATSMNIHFYNCIFCGGSPTQTAPPCTVSGVKCNLGLMSCMGSLIVPTAESLTTANSMIRLALSSPIATVKALQSVIVGELTKYATGSRTLTGSTIIEERGQSIAVTTTVTGGAAAWTASGTWFEQTKSISGVLDTDNPIVSLVYSGNEVSLTDMETSFNKIKIVTAGIGSLTFKCQQVPATDVTVRAILPR